MANTLQFDLVSPERRLASLAATEVQIPGAEGEMTAMEGHSPVITTLRPGVLRAVSPTGTQAFAVTGGFAEITATGVSVLAEQAIPLEELSPAVLDRLIAEARDQAAATPAEARDAADRLVNDMLALRVSTGH